MATHKTVVVMGVSGSGKSSVGELLAEKLGVPFIDGDNFHPKANVDKMAAGIPLTDEDRWPWLDILGTKIRELAQAEGGVVLAASSLRRVYRERMISASGENIMFAHLDGSAEVIGARMANRKGHYMPPSLLESQLATLEPPEPDENAIALSIEEPPTAIVAQILARL
ncbi:MAG: gluconokinase [Pseudomonadota bacterium]